MHIGVIGGGVVGRATARVYMEHHEVRVYDLVKERSTHTRDDVLDCDLVFVCLPGDAVERFFFELYGTETVRNFVLKSTVSIGTTRRLADKYGLANLVHSPEFLTERCSLVDAQTPARNVIGQPDWQGTAHNSRCLSLLEDLYIRRFPGVPIHLMSSDESEAVKLFANGFFAVKIAYWNEVRALADHLGMDWKAVMAAVLADGRIAHSHTQVPGPDGLRGFGGKCLPADLDALATDIVRAGLTASVTAGAIHRNEADRKREP